MVFHDVTFGGETYFDGASFVARADFTHVTFRGRVVFGDAKFHSDADFSGSTFDDEFHTPRYVARAIALVNTKFSQPTRIALVARVIFADRIQFPQGGAIGVRWASISLSEVQFSRPTTLYALNAINTPNLKDAEGAVLEGTEWGFPYYLPDPRPRLVSLAFSDVAGLTCMDVSMGACDLFGTSNLDQLRLDGITDFLRAPGLRHWRFQTIRDTLVDEHRLRGWPLIEARRFSDTTDPRRAIIPGERSGPTEARRIAGLYRALRKAREERKDVPGAADFYYGEMEMRRMSPTSRTDWAVLFVYWLISGYGLRASRALFWFGLVVLAFSGAFWLDGLKTFPGWTLEGWLVALRASFLSATSLLRPPPANLSSSGEVIDAVLRVLGTGLLGLALFSLRGRIKR